ncbi:unnamed protein product, partial [Ectocarpus fasciculatus]
PDPFEVAADEGPIILTRSELQRRTRERSRLAALKVAEEHGKERKRREIAAKRKSAAKAVAAQARRENAFRFRRETLSAAGPEEAGGGSGGRRGGAGTAVGEGSGTRARSHSPRGVTETR